MAIPFADYKESDALGALSGIVDECQRASLDFLTGDHWQEGRAWVGPPDQDVEGRAAVLENKIKPVFISKNIVGEIVGAERDAVIGKEPDWSFTTREPLRESQKPDTETQRLIDDATNLLTQWQDSKKFVGTLQDAADNCLATGRGPLRLVVPSAYIDENGKPAPGDMATWLGRIYLKAPDLDRQAVVSDEDSMRQAGIFAVDCDGKKKIEMSFLDAAGRTILRKLEDGRRIDSSPLDLGGNLLHFEMRRKPLVTEQIRKNQALFNTTLTMRCRNVGVGGFPERNFLNARPPSHFIDDPANPGKQIEIFDKHKTGPGVTNYTIGDYVEDPVSGEIKHAWDASVSYRDPVNVDTFEKTEACAYANILQESKQLHRLMSRDATAAAESRVQARGDFATAARKTKTEIDPAGRWALETVLLLAAALSGDKRPWGRLRARFESKIDTGPISPDERRVILEEVKAGARSLQNAMTLLGIDDPKAMLEEIARERKLLGAPPATDKQPSGAPGAMPQDAGGQPQDQSTVIQ